MNTERYIELIRKFIKFIPALRWKRGVDIGYCDLPARWSNIALLEHLHRYFPGDRLIFYRTEHPWPPYSPDLSPLELFFVGMPKRQGLC